MDGWRLAKVVAKGVIGGLLLYVAFMFLPLVLASLTGYEPPSSPYTFFVLLVFIGVSTASGLLSGTVYSPLLSMLDRLLGFLLLLEALPSGAVKTSIPAGGYVVSLSVDVMPLLAFLLVTSLAFSILDFLKLAGAE